MEKNGIEEQVQLTLDRLQNIRVEPTPPFLYEKVMEKLARKRNAESLRPFPALPLAFTCLIFIGINLLTYSHLVRIERIRNEIALEKLASGYFSSDVFGY